MTTEWPVNICENVNYEECSLKSILCDIHIEQLYSNNKNIYENNPMAIEALLEINRQKERQIGKGKPCLKDDANDFCHAQFMGDGWCYCCSSIRIPYNQNIIWWIVIFSYPVHSTETIFDWPLRTVRCRHNLHDILNINIYLRFKCLRIVPCENWHGDDLMTGHSDNGVTIYFYHCHHFFRCFAHVT